MNRKLVNFPQMIVFKIALYYIHFVLRFQWNIECTANRLTFGKVRVPVLRRNMHIFSLTVKNCASPFFNCYVCSVGRIACDEGMSPSAKQTFRLIYGIKWNNELIVHHSCEIERNCSVCWWLFCQPGDSISKFKCLIVITKFVQPYANR